MRTTGFSQEGKTETVESDASLKDRIVTTESISEREAARSPIPLLVSNGIARNSAAAQSPITEPSLITT